MQKKRQHDARYDNYDKVFQYDNLYEAGHKCCSNVRWKASVQRFESNLLLTSERIYREVREESFKSGHFRNFDLYERGHLRHIRSLPVEERMVQRSLCDNSLIPVLSRSFIYDNGACMKGKGISFAEKRLREHLRQHYQQYGCDGYALVFDFSKYFDNADHDTIKEILRKSFTDERLIKITSQFVDDFGEVGLGLGSQISQILSLALANRLDHEIKDRLRMKHYVRYMDDGCVIHRCKERLKEVLDIIRIVCDELHIKLNQVKTRIIKLSRGFTFLKIRYYLMETGRILKKMAHDGVKRQRRRMKKFRILLDRGKITISTILSSISSWLAHCRRSDSYQTRLEMIKRFFLIFPEIPRYAIKCY